MTRLTFGASVIGLGAGCLALATAIVTATPAAARQWSAVCTNLAGMRVDDAASGPEFAQDSIKGAAWTYSWDTTTGRASLTLPASHASDGKPHTQAGEVSLRRGGFYTIVSSLPGAVWTHAIYTETGRLLATQSSTKGGSNLAGRMLVGNCTISTK